MTKAYQDIDNIDEATQKCANDLLKLLMSRVVQNVQKLGSRALNTVEIARQCKRLMVTYNIGQRLFAKYVMNQVVKSQGSLSELLSKPRHWNKLTDKGREAFRRMYGWISDEKAIDLLCSISPRRVHPAGDVKIEAPLAESLWETGASVAPYMQYPDSGSEYDENTSKKNQKIVESNSASPGCTQTRSSSRWRHDDIPKEKIITIFQNELAKLREQVCYVAALNSSSHSSSLISQNFTTNQTHLLFALKYRSGMSAITQEQLEQYAVLDTEEIVCQIKDYLSTHSISQRLFGEHVLGLSQGSVSDLLARPKPWSMLTQKGREPFIRMRLFLNEAAVITDGSVNQGDTSMRKFFEFFHRIFFFDSVCLLNHPFFSNKVIFSSNLTFGETILKMNVTETSNLFSKCDSWNHLSSHDKESFTLMNSWLHNSNGIEEILKNLPIKSESVQKNSSTASKTTSNKRKICRTVITDQQKEALKFVFEHDQHPSQRTIEQLSKKLSLNIRTVSNWFHNYRTRQKDLTELLEMASKPLPTNDWPTMVRTQISCKSLRNDSSKNCSDSQLDKAIARLQLLAAAKQS
ncbi:unnamed protein product [Dracunculus medinensis]|uniref:DNA-binding protein SATB n=1 Tax=Dracunculus medinensis TaxID=318479 RepID=A0A0N4UQE3_DRAME|nr:unnamed protein product [Dracunculus medinensis]